MFNSANLAPHAMLLVIAAIGLLLVLKHLFHIYRLNDPFYRLRQIENSRIVIDRK